MQSRKLPENISFLRPQDETEQGLIRGCLEYPWDDARFLIFADWLEENDYLAVAEYIRGCLHWKNHWQRPPKEVREYWSSRVGDTLAENNGYLRGFPAVWHTSLGDWLTKGDPSEDFSWGLNLRDFTLQGFIELLASERLANYSVLCLNPLRSHEHFLSIQQLLSSRRVVQRISALDHLCAFNLTDALIGQLNAETLLESIQFRQLESLVLEGNHIFSAGFLFRSGWQHLRRLRGLDLAANQMEIGNLFDAWNFQLYPNLQYLRLSWNRVSIAADRQRAPLFPELQELHMVGTELNPNSIQALAQSNHFPKLQRLYLKHNKRLTRESLFQLLTSENLPALRMIQVDRFPITKRDRFQKLAKEKRIEVIF